MVPNPPSPSTTAVTVVLVTYESARDLAMCLGSLERAAGPHPLEVVVVDNASTDASVEIARGYGAKVLENHTNQGLSRAINTGVAVTGAPWLLIANPDTWLSPGSLRRLLATATSDPRIGCVGPHLANPDGSDYPTGRRFPSMLMGAVHAAVAPLWPDNPATRRYHMAGVDRSRPLDVDWVSGACMLIRRQAFEQVGGFDPGYFMYFEEMDLCLRLHRVGWRLCSTPWPRSSTWSAGRPAAPPTARSSTTTPAPSASTAAATPATSAWSWPPWWPRSWPCGASPPWPGPPRPAARRQPRAAPGRAAPTSWAAPRRSRDRPPTPPAAARPAGLPRPA